MHDEAGNGDVDIVKVSDAATSSTCKEEIIYTSSNDE
jgi:hypothetical protein